MAISDIQICNQALGHVGSKAFIEDLTEESTEAAVFKLHFDTVRDQLLERHPWDFAERTAVLAEIEVERPNWAHVFALPADCVKALFLGARNQPPAMRPSFRVLSDGTVSRVLCTNESSATLTYTARVKTPSAYDALFVEAFAWALAEKLAMPLTGKTDIAEYSRKMAALKLAEASAGSSNTGWEQEPESSIIAERG